MRVSNFDKRLNNLLDDLCGFDLRTSVGVDKARRSLRLAMKEQDRDTRHKVKLEMRR